MKPEENSDAKAEGEAGGDACGDAQALLGEARAPLGRAQFREGTL